MRRGTLFLILFFISIGLSIVAFILIPSHDYGESRVLQISFISTPILYLLFEFKKISDFFKHGVTVNIRSSGFLALVGLFLILAGNKFDFDEFAGYYIGKFSLAILFIITGVLSPKTSKTTQGRS